MESLFNRYHSFIESNAKLLVALIPALLLLFAQYTGNLTVSSDFRAYFSEDNPQLQAFEELERTFSRQDNLFFYIEAKNGDLFNRESLAAVWKLSEDSWQIPYAERVLSITHHQHTYAINDHIITQNLVESPEKLDPEKIEQIKSVALNEPALLHNLLSPDGKSTGIYVGINLPDDNDRASVEVIKQARMIADDIRQQYPQLEILVAGSTASNVTMGEAVADDLVTLGVASYLLIALGLYLFLRSMLATLAVLVLMGFSVLATFSFFGAIGLTLTPVAGFVPTMVMTLAVADSIHIITSYFHSSRQQPEKRLAIREALRINASPVFITSLTTIIGMLTLNFSESPPYRDLGNMVAFGVLIAYLLSMTLLPAFLHCFAVQQGKRNNRQIEFIDHLSGFIIHHYKILSIGIGLLVMVLATGIFQTQLTERWHEYFSKKFEIRQAVEKMNVTLAGAHRIHYQIHSRQENGINDPGFLSDISFLTDWARHQPEVGYVETLTDTIKKLNQTMHQEQPEYYEIPAEREMIAQYLLLYELSLPRGMDLQNQVSIDRSSLRISIVLHKTDSENILAFNRKLTRWANQNLGSIHVDEGTGLDMIFAHIMHRNIRALLKGTAVALLLISGILIVTLKSVKIGLLSLIPNLMPAALAYGIWGYGFGYIDLALSIVIAMSLGIVVDDTVHFLSKYLWARRQQNKDVLASIRFAFHTVGIALITTTSALVAGFLVMLLSQFTPTHETGTLLAITLIAALLIDFFLLPPLLIHFDRADKN